MALLRLLRRRRRQVTALRSGLSRRPTCCGRHSLSGASPPGWQLQVWVRTGEPHRGHYGPSRGSGAPLVPLPHCMLALQALQVMLHGGQHLPPTLPCPLPYQQSHTLSKACIVFTCHPGCLPPRAGSSIMAALSEVGLVPRLDVLSLEEAERAFPVLEPPDVTPKYLKKLSLEEVLGEGRAGRRREGLSLQGQGRGGGREGELGSELLMFRLKVLWVGSGSASTQDCMIIQIHIIAPPQERISASVPWSERWSCRSRPSRRCWSPTGSSRPLAAAGGEAGVQGGGRGRGG